jgi:hypothetical protein
MAPMRMERTLWSVYRQMAYYGIGRRGSGSAFASVDGLWRGGVAAVEEAIPALADDVGNDLRPPQQIVGAI